MPLIASALANEMKTQIQGAQSASEAMSKLGSAISNYIKENCNMLALWQGYYLLVPEIMVAPAMIININITLTPSMATDATTAMTILGTQLMTGCAVAQYNMDYKAGFATSPGIFGIPTPCPLIPSMATQQMPALINMAQNIISWFIGWIPSMPMAGTHGQFIGTASVITVF